MILFTRTDVKKDHTSSCPYVPNLETSHGNGIICYPLDLRDMKFEGVIPRRGWRDSTNSFRKKPI